MDIYVTIYYKLIGDEVYTYLKDSLGGAPIRFRRADDAMELCRRENLIRVDGLIFSLVFDKDRAEREAPNHVPAAAGYDLLEEAGRQLSEGNTSALLEFEELFLANSGSRFLLKRLLEEVKRIVSPRAGATVLLLIGAARRKHRLPPRLTEHHLQVILEYARAHAHLEP